jgi:hypothetical protein
MRHGGITRRFLIAAGGSTVLSPVAGSQPTMQPLVIGVLTDQTGIGAAFRGRRP